jgi:hypothetical protein
VSAKPRAVTTGQHGEGRQLVRLVDAGKTLIAQVAEDRLGVVPDGDGGRGLADAGAARAVAPSKPVTPFSSSKLMSLSASTLPKRRCRCEADATEATGEV